MIAFTFLVEEHLLEYGSVVILGFYLVVWNQRIGNASAFGRKLLSPVSEISELALRYN